MLRIAGRLSGVAFAAAVLALTPGVAGADHLTRGRDHLFAHPRLVRLTHVGGLRAVREAGIVVPTYELVSSYDGKCLDVYGGATGNGSRVDQWTCHGGSNQLWKVFQAGTTSGNLPIYEFMGVGSGRCLDVYGFGNSNGATVDIWDCNGGANQRWDDFPMNGNDLIAENTIPTGSQTGDSKTLEVYGGATGNGARVDIWAMSASTTSGWKFR